MTNKIHGTAGAHQSLAGAIEYYIAFVKDPIDLTVTGSVNDITQKNFEVFLQSVGLRAMPVLMTDPLHVVDLSLEGAPTMVGSGFVWKFSVEIQRVFQNDGPNGTVSDVGFLIDEMDGIVLPSGDVLDTKSAVNTEFLKTEFI